MTRFLSLALLTIGAIAPAFAAPRAPSLKPALVYESRVLSQADFTRLDSGLDAADAGRWTEAKTVQAQIQDADAKRLMQWRIATSTSSRARFAELQAALVELKDWPGERAIRVQAEREIANSTLSPGERIAWFGESGATTGEGKLVLAEAHRQLGQIADADALIRDAWRNNVLSDSATKRVLSNSGNLLTSEDHRDRVEMLIWTSQRTAARRLLPRLTTADRRVAEARIALIESRRGVDSAVGAVPRSHVDDPGLLHDRARWRRKKGRTDDAIPLLMVLRAEDAIEVGRNKIWTERNLAARNLIKRKDYRAAYTLAADHGLTSGGAFADAEWMAGWLALRYLNDAAAAEAHFSSLAQGVGTPISLGRAHYWRGEALSALGRPNEALLAYQEAANHPFTFYGQLAAEKVGDSAASIDLKTPSGLTDADRKAFEARPQVRAAILLAETGRLRSFEKFSYDIDDRLTTPEEHQMLFDLAWSYLQPRAGVRSAKTGLAKGLVAPAAAYPVLDLPPSRNSGSAEEALVLALSRQESELNPRAISHANARGMMQMLPSTARATARQVGMPYRQSWLTDDPDYNFTLGRSHLDDLVDEFNGSYIMAAAAYNAGASRPRRWIKEYGDPRKGSVDPVDWIESIPF
ncbi:MAG: lytic transglycosylase domain-containing protein [Pseudomonadota bacterium]